MTQADKAARAERILGHQFKNADLLTTALTHSSAADSKLASNERLEFLGDAVLGVVVCHELFRRYADWLEGDLTKVKSVVVSGRVCAEMADAAGLSELLTLGNGIDRQHPSPERLRAAVYEAVVGALYLDGGTEAAQPFILETCSPFIERFAVSQTHGNYKSALQQYAQHWLGVTPQYEALDEQGPDHSKCFEVSVVIKGESFPGAWGPSKKDAEQEAARQALEILKRRKDHPES